MTGARRLVLEDPSGRLDLSVAAGECVALLASDAPAASMLIDQLAGHAALERGRLLLDGNDVTAHPPAQRRIGVISPRDPLFGHLSVRRNVAFPLAARGLREPGRGHRVQQALALLDLQARADCLPRDLSPADALRAALARALVSDCTVLLLDDALRSLDPASRRDMHHVLRRLSRACVLTLLAVTTDREEALMLGDRIGILDGTCLRQLAKAAELLDRPADERVATGFGEANSLTGQVEWVEDDVARVRLSAGPSMEAMAASALAPGALCSVCVRPERIAVAFISHHEGGAFGADALSGTLSDLVHLGDHLRLRFRLSGGGDLLVRRPAAQPTAGLHIDRPAQLAWQAAHAVAFPQEP